MILWALRCRKYRGGTCKECRERGGFAADCWHSLRGSGYTPAVYGFKPESLPRNVEAVEVRLVLSNPTAEMAAATWDMVKRILTVPPPGAE